MVAQKAALKAAKLATKAYLKVGTMAVLWVVWKAWRWAA